MIQSMGGKKYKMFIIIFIL